VALGIGVANGTTTMLLADPFKAGRASTTSSMVALGITPGIDGSACVPAPNHVAARR
jgi:hypothetical protein